MGWYGTRMCEFELWNSIMCFFVFDFASRCIPTHSKVCRRNPVLRHFRMFSPNSRVVACLVAELNAASVAANIPKFIYIMFDDL